MKDTQGAQGLAVGGLDGRRPGRPEAGRQSVVSTGLPERILGYVRDQNLTPEVHGGGARAVANIDGAVRQPRRKLFRQMGRDDVREGLAPFGQHADRTNSPNTDRLDQTRDRRQHLLQSGVAGKLGEDLALGGGHPLATLTLGNVGNASPHQPPAPARQTHQADLAMNLLAERVQKQPLVHEGLSVERSQRVGPGALRRRDAVRLQQRTEFDRPDLQQLSPVEPKELFRVLVGVDEPYRVHVEDDDCFRCVVDQKAVSRLTLAHSLFGLASVGDVTQAENEHLATRERSFADRELGRKGLPVLTLSPGFTGGEVELRVTGRCRQTLQGLGDGFVDGDFGNQQVDPLADDLGFAEAKHPFPGRVESLDRAVLIDGENHVFDVVEDDLQVLGTLLAGFVRERSCLIGHEAHRLDDATALVVDGLVLRADQLEQHGYIRLRGAGAQTDLLQLRPQLRV